MIPMKLGTPKGKTNSKPKLPRQRVVHPGVMNTFEQSVARNRDLLQCLAK